MATDPWTAASVLTKAGDVLLRAIRAVFGGSARRSGRRRRIGAVPLRAGWRELRAVEYGGIAWRPQIPVWGYLLGHEMQPEPSLIEQARLSLNVAGPFCPRCGTEMSAPSWRVPLLGQRWVCDACRRSAWLRRDLSDAVASVERLTRARLESEAVSGGRLA
jgi:hypothetical protein